MTMQNLELQYFFDPLCGWCYASAPALVGLAERHGAALRMMPVGLFMQPRPIAGIAEFAWQNDQRIATLTGQHFSEAYREQVLLAADGVFDSTPLTRALTALGEQDAALELRLLHTAQLARYVDGVDTCRVEAVAQIALDVARSAGLDLDLDAFSARLSDDRSLADATAQRVTRAQQAMQALPSGGVPQLLLKINGTPHVIAGQPLYEGPQRLLTHIASLL
ncbi:Protein-disulfide isomerase-like protein [Pseudomonas sp. 8Z]|uniref:DsbA family protein n=1 Tax=Pseudomonas sp. 8Z TaxID=2653166 RepID=UPI0012EFB36A|nr:DsbA family protein [Pseudomonas sp. 8Z]VXD05039.1 Protein-disulfide isomerase-like protein [Pseudomonas sp. 8Z]